MKPEIEMDFRDVQIPDMVSITYYVGLHNSLPIFTKFCMRLRNVVASKPIVCQNNREYFAHFRGVRISIPAVFRLY